MRVALGCIGHETNTFSSVPTTMESFKEVYRGEQIMSAFRQTSTITGGFIEQAEKTDLQIVPLLWTFATPSGIVQQQAYDTLKAEFLTLLRDAGPLDGVFLDLHGAMVTEDLEDAEGDLIRAVRTVVADLPIIVTLDLHANITAAMANVADTIIGFDTYPHVDCYDRGLEAARVMFDMLQGTIQPTMAYRQLPLLTAPPAQCTMKPLMEEVVQHLHALEARPGVVTATLSMGFPFADIQDTGVSVLVTTDNDQRLAEKYADEFAEYLWDKRMAFDIDLVSVDAAIKRVKEAEGQPVVLAEGSDNPGGGGPCDGTIILRAFIEADVQGAVFAVIADPESVALAIQAGVGHNVDLQIGGKTMPLHGEPVVATGYVKTISDGRYVYKGSMGRGRIGKMGRTAVVTVGGIEIILTERRDQPYDCAVLRRVGIEPKDRKAIVLKSAVHYRADYTPIAHDILEVDTPGVHSPDLFSYDYKNLRRPIYPLDGGEVPFPVH